MLFLRGARGEIERVYVAAGAAIAERQRPKLVDLDGFAAFILKGAQKRASARIECVDARTAFTEISHQQGAAEEAERTRWARGRNREAPGRVERAVRDEAGQKCSVCIKFADVAVSRSGQFVSRRGIELGIGDVKRSAEVLDVKW